MAVEEQQAGRYPAYQPTGVEWMPEIPAGWEVKKLKYFASVETGGTPPKNDDSNYDDNGIPWIKPDNLDEFMPIKNSKEKLSDSGKAFARIIPKGSVLICGIGSIGKLGVAGCDLTTNQQINSVIFDGKVEPGFGKYLLRAGQEEMLRNSSKVVVAILTKSALLDLIFPYPSLAEQRAIARFLDDKTAQIDQLITQKQQMLELLREERAALTNHAVTKGLDAAAPLRDSGVEWLGEVPAHWEVKQLKHITSLIQTGPFGSQLHAEDYVEDGIPVINPAHLQNGVIVPSQKVSVSVDTRDRLDRHILAEGDIVFARRGEMGRCALVTLESAGWLCGTGSLKVTLTQNLVLPKFLFKVLSNHGVKELLSLESVGSTMENLNTDILSRIQLPLPSVHEQQEIVDYLHIKEQELLLTTATINQEISLLQEYRAALIAEAVTGQIDVRHYALAAAVLM